MSRRTSRKWSSNLHRVQELVETPMGQLWRLHCASTGLNQAPHLPTATNRRDTAEDVPPAARGLKKLLAKIAEAIEFAGTIISKGRPLRKGEEGIMMRLYGSLPREPRHPRGLHRQAFQDGRYGPWPRNGQVFGCYCMTACCGRCNYRRFSLEARCRRQDRSMTLSRA